MSSLPLFRASLNNRGKISKLLNIYSTKQKLVFLKTFEITDTSLLNQGHLSHLSLNEGIFSIFLTHRSFLSVVYPFSQRGYGKGWCWITWSSNGEGKISCSPPPPPSPPPTSCPRCCWWRSWAPSAAPPPQILSCQPTDPGVEEFWLDDQIVDNVNTR